MLLQSTSQCQEFQAQMSHVTKELMIAKTEVLKASGMPPMIRKETERGSMLKMIGDAILFTFSVIVFRTKPLTRLRSLCEVIFDNELFGSFATQRVLKDISKKYARTHVFLPWRVLRSIDLTINGGINLTGLESLQKVEDLEDYQRGFLPSRTSVQNCAAELHALGQQLIPIVKVPCDLGEMYQYDYEKMVQYIIKAFSLHEIAQNDNIELCITLEGAELMKDLCHLSFGVKNDGWSGNQP
jgi:hypothetical protein